MRRVWTSVRPLVRQDITEHFRAGDSPAGSWAPWAASTMERFRGARRSVGPGPYSHEHRDRVHARRKNVRADGRLSAGGIRRVQNMLGRLKTAWRFVARARELIAESVVSWADVQHVGGQVGHGATLPARAWMWMNDALVGTIGAIIVQHLAEGW
jgi:hypothetical protein